MSGFGSSGSGFPAMNSPFGSPFGTSGGISTPQQQQPAPPPTFGSSFTTANYSNNINNSSGVSFGTSPHVNPFGTATTTATHSQSVQTFQPTPFDSSSSSSTSVFGSAYNATTYSFGSQNQTQPFSSGNPFGASSSSTPAAVSFAAPASFPAALPSQPWQQPQQQTLQQNPFGTPSSSNNNNSQKRAPFTSPFGSSSFPSQQDSSYFGNGPTKTNNNNIPISFAMSSNVMQPNNLQSQQQQNDLDMATFSPTNEYATEIDMMAPDQQSQQTSFGKAAAAFPFGQATQQTTVPHKTWTQQAQEPVTLLNAHAPVFTPFGKQIRQHADDSDYQQDADEELAKLKAKIEEKKKRLEQKRKKEQEQASRSPTPPAAPVDSLDTTNATSKMASLAQRNALRFQQSITTQQAERNTQPTRQHVATATAATTASGIAITEREDLQNAVSLVGTCPFMCPEEELQRREAEGDIQLLEIPKPGTLHPKEWTLRETAVKRFRRSAADYKLDVPEWVRPPDVLEDVMGYLEEWVMERDRQGKDPRFPQSGVPPPLDVYQFIWDRTRMIRKDFILQNYVGTGGNCDARAVRCHERIARWHVMCEHQLSHLTDFVKAQSQQNISELGQTLKSLNQFYDDSLERSRVEVPDEMGRETREGPVTGTVHGCRQSAVQGADPIDYDGTPLDNTSHGAHRMIGSQALDSPDHGTSEAEMRGLYILLTIDNDGGMEVLKYAGRLYSERPDVYHSSQVQLAMSVFMARREYNYARFFNILRSPDTPYLYACLMFKQVELMRKSAFRIMSKTYGGRSKDNTPIYDAFPLKNLSRLLCFESLDEARTACEHYGITVEPTKIRTSSGTAVEDVIFWRRSTFREPTDDEKGTVIPLPPRKMWKTIESKLHGATRLAVCRGQVSVIGTPSHRPDTTINSSETVSRKATEDLDKRPGELGATENKEDTREKSAREEAEAVATETARREAEQRAEEDRLREVAFRARQQQEAALRAESMRREAERRAHQEKEEEARRIALETELARRKNAEEEQRKADEFAALERARREAIAQVERDESERLRKQAIDKARREREERNRREAAEEAQNRAAEEKKLQEKRTREEKIWKKRRDHARKRLVVRRLLMTRPRRLPDDDQSEIIHLRESLGKGIEERHAYSWLDTSPKELIARTSLRQSLESCLTMTVQYPIAQWISEYRLRMSCSSPSMLLLTIGVLTHPSSNHAEAFLANTWVLSRVQGGRYSADGVEVRVSVQHIRDETAKPWAVDGILMVDLERSNVVSRSLEDQIDTSAPAAVLKFQPDGEVLSTKAVVASCQDLRPESLERALHTCITNLVVQLSQISPVSIERFSLSTVCFLMSQRVVESALNIESWDDFLPQVIIGLTSLVDYLDSIALSQGFLPNWPPPCFANGSDAVDSYFSGGGDLPLTWLSSLQRDSTAPFVEDLSRCLSSVEEAVNTFLSDAPAFIREESQALLEKRDYRKALVLSFQWRQERREEAPFVYFPRGMLGDVMLEAGRLAIARITQSPLYPAIKRYKDPLRIDNEPLNPGKPAHADLGNQHVDNHPTCSTRSVISDGPKRAMESSIKSASRSSKKMKRSDNSSFVSVEVDESRNFTRKLEAYLLGTTTSDAFVGSQPLSSYLVGAPDLRLS